MKSYNIFIELLKELGVKYTLNNAMKLYQKHPHRYDLFGLSDMLNFYGVENVAVNLNEKQQIFDVDPPWIVYLNNDFVLVRKNNNGVLDCLCANGKLSFNIDYFLKIWSGLVLFVESNDDSIEPYYLDNRKKLVFDFILDFILYAIIIVAAIYAFYLSGLWTGLGNFILVIVLLCVYVCVLLLKKQINAKSSNADSFCSILKNNNCDYVLHSKMSKIFNFFSWAEIGFSYFISILVIYLIFPKWISYCAWIGVLSLPYSFWSIIYQKYVLKQYCPMCLIIVCSFWLIFVLNIINGNLYLFDFLLLDVLGVLGVFIVLFLIVHKIIPVVSDLIKMSDLEFHVNSFKYNTSVFVSLLKESKYYEVSFSVSRIIFGDINSNIIVTVLVNPYCTPCANVHLKLDYLLKNIDANYCVQYIFASFNDDYRDGSRALISSYLKSSERDAIDLFNDWFNVGKYHKDDFVLYNDLQFDDETEVELSSHERWVEINNLNTTPLILINGYKLPFQYDIDDLKYLKLNCII